MRIGPSIHIDHRQALRILKAVRFTERVGPRLNVFITVNFRHAAIEVDRMSAAFERLRDNHFTKWIRDEARRQERSDWLPVRYVWAMENPAGDPNLHWLLHVPAPLQKRFDVKLYKWLEKVGGQLDPSQVVVHTSTASEPIIGALYLLKGTNPRYAKALKLKVCKDQGIVPGKRAGVSKSLGPAAIARYLKPVLAVENTDTRTSASRALSTRNRHLSRK